MDGDGCRTAHGIQLPDTVIQCLLAEDDLRMLCEKKEQIKLACRKNHLISPKKYATRLWLNLKRVKMQDGRIPRTSLESLIARKMCLDACHQLTRTERFDDIIIRPQSECAYFIDILKARRDHEDGDIVCFPNIAADGKSIRPRQHHIQQKQIIVPRHSKALPRIAVRRNIDSKAIRFEIVTLQLGNGSVILDQQYLLHACPPFSESAAAGRCAAPLRGTPRRVPCRRTSS